MNSRANKYLSLRALPPMRQHRSAALKEMLSLRGVPQERRGNLCSIEPEIVRQNSRTDSSKELWRTSLPRVARNDTHGLRQF